MLVATATALAVLAFLCLVSWVITAIAFFELRKEQKEHDQWIRRMCDRITDLEANWVDPDRHDREINALGSVTASICNRISELERKTQKRP